MPDISLILALFAIVLLILFVGGVGFWIGRWTAKSTVQNLQARVAEEKERLVEIRTQMEASFKAIAADTLRDNSAEFLKHANENLDSKKELIDQRLGNMNQKLDTIHKQSTELKSSIDTSQKTTAELNQTATHLREVLSSSQKRGQWGERMVEDILQFVGLKENVNYTKQRQVESGEKPDYTFILPQEKKLNMDVKFPLASYERYLANANQASGESDKKEFLHTVRKHIEAVHKRGYINPAEGTLNYVMLFIPNESIYGFINAEDGELIDYALQKRVLLCSPLTLYAMLSLIHQAAQNFTMNERAAEVIGLVNQFRNQWDKYVELMDKLGRSIESLRGDYGKLVTTRTRALEKPLDKIENITLPAGNAGEKVNEIPADTDVK